MSLSQASVLVVDDDALNRKLLAKRLEREGHRVTAAADGRVGLELLRCEPFDIALLGFATDYADPNAFVRPLLWSGNIGEKSTNVAYFQSPRFDRMLARASLLTGQKRYAAFANLDRVTTRDAAPIAAFVNENSRFYVSESLGCFTAQFGLVNLVAVCKK